MSDNLIERMDEFVRKVIPSHKITHAKKKSMGEELLKTAEAIYSAQDLDTQKLLAKRIDHLRRIMRRFAKEEIATLEGKLSASTRYLEALRAAPPSGQVSAEIARVGAEIDRMRARLPQLRQERGAVLETIPSELQAAAEIRAGLEEISSSEESLRDAITKAEAEMQRLESFRSGLDASRHEIWGRQAQSEIKALGDLIQRWNSQLKYLKKQEGLARTYQWQTDKAEELTRRYMTNVEISQVQGKSQTEAIKLFRDALAELENILRVCQIISATAETRVQPETLPIESLRSAIEKFEAILEGLRDKLPTSDVRWATRKLEVAKYELAKLEGTSITLGYQTELETEEKRKSSEGIQYFRANLPEIAREILSERTIAKLEKDLASTGVGGAQKAITEAMIMASRQNPERVRTATGG